MAANTVIYSASDDYSGKFLTAQAIPQEFTSHIGGIVEIGKHVIIGASSTIIGACKIGEGCSVGSMSLVIKDLCSWFICAGIPAKTIKERSKEVLIQEHELIKKYPEFE
jgi:serine acetyltransferase